MPPGYTSDISRSEFEDYEEKKYNELKKGIIKLRTSGSSYYTCPFCYGKRDYNLDELLQHASSVGYGSQQRSLREKARHIALKRYMRRYLDVGESSECTPKIESPMDLAPSKDLKLVHKEDRSESASRTYCSSKGESPVKCDHNKHMRTPSRKDRSEFTSTTYSSVAQNPEKDGEQLFVFPWMGIVANIQTQWENGKRVGESGTKLRDELLQKGFEPVRVHPLWNRMGHSGVAIVEFNKDWQGFKNAIMFEKHFEVQRCGKRDYVEQRRFLGDKLFGWMARSDDFRTKSLVGDHLRKNGDLKSVSDKEAEDERKDSKLVSSLANTLQMKHKQLQEIENMYMETGASLIRVMNEKEAMVESYNNEKRKMQQNERNHLEKISFEHEKITQELEAKREKLEQKEKQLLIREVHNESARMKILQDKKMIENATLEQKKADNDVIKLAEEQKREKEELHKKIIELERKLDAKQALELEIERMKGSLQVMKHMDEDEDQEIKKKMDTIRLELKEKEEELEHMEKLNQTLVIMQRKSNDELQDARKELISYFKEVGSRAFIGVKRMGALDSKPFLTVAKRKFQDEEAEEKAVELCSQWEEHLRDPQWHPFKVITDKDGNPTEEIIDEEDEKIKELKNEGAEVYDAVQTALKELNEYNASGRYIIQELWNFKEQKKATLKEGAEFILRQWKLHKRRKT